MPSTAQRFSSEIMKVITAIMIRFIKYSVSREKKILENEEVEKE